MELILALVAVAFQALFSGSETGLVRANWIRVRTRASENRRLAGSALRLLERKENVLIMTLVGTNLFIIIASTLSARFFLHTFGARWTFLSVIAMSAVVLIFGTYLPKAVAQAQPESWLAILAPFLEAAWVILYPVTWLLGRISGIGMARKTDHAVTRTDVVFALRENARGSAAGTRIGGIAARLLDFPELTVRDVMTPVDRVVSVPEDMPADTLARRFAEHSYTRLPVYRDQPDNIIGVVSLRDLLYTGQRTISPPLTVSEAARTIAVMNLMREGRSHMAVVLNDQHKMTGIVTLEDLLEELVGEIRSEE